MPLPTAAVEPPDPLPRLEAGGGGVAVQGEVVALYPDDLETADLLLAGCLAPVVVNEAIWMTGDPVRGFDVAEALINQGLLRVVRVDTADLYRASVQTQTGS